MFLAESKHAMNMSWTQARVSRDAGMQRIVWRTTRAWPGEGLLAAGGGGLGGGCKGGCWGCNVTLPLSMVEGIGVLEAGTAVLWGSIDLCFGDIKMRVTLLLMIHTLITPVWSVSQLLTLRGLGRWSYLWEGPSRRFPKHAASPGTQNTQNTAPPKTPLFVQDPFICQMWNASFANSTLKLWHSHWVPEKYIELLNNLVFVRKMWNCEWGH